LGEAEKKDAENLVPLNGHPSKQDNKDRQ